MLLANWLVEIMAQWIAPETERDFDRYTDIAADAVEVASDPEERPLYDAETDGEARWKTAVLLLSVASYEGGFRADIDQGRTLGDHGRAFCLMQIHPGPGLRMTEDGGYVYDSKGWHGRDLIRDRQKCFRAALHMMRTSIETCERFGELSALALYTRGRCVASDQKAAMHILRAREVFP